MIPVRVIAFTSPIDSEDDIGLAVLKEIDGSRHGVLVFPPEVADILAALLEGPTEPAVLHQITMQVLEQSGTVVSRIELTLGERIEADTLVQYMVYFRQNERTWSMPVRMFDAVGFSIAGKLPIHIPEDDLAYLQERSPSLEDLGCAAPTESHDLDDAERQALHLPKNRLGNA